jgi:hypothetical protein
MVCDCNTCEIEALKSKVEHQQYEITDLRESQSQLRTSNVGEGGKMR